VDETKARPARLNTEFLIAEALKGNHLLFPKERIVEAFSRNLPALQAALEARREEIGRTVSALLSLGSLEQGREFVSSLSRDVQHILILLYFQLLEGVLQRRKPTIH
jgi:hypothetical protein